MAKEAFIVPERGFYKKNKLIMNYILDIVDDYNNKNLTLTSRQVFYQLVSRNIVSNNEDEYNKVCGIISDGRWWGLIDWDMIEDRTRKPHQRYYENGISGAIEGTLSNYRLDRLRNQDIHIEVMIEKRAIFEIVTNVTDFYTMIVTANNGNTSDTILRDCSKRLIEAHRAGKSNLILYIGDHDPSGMMMTENIPKKLSMMQTPDFEFRPIALTKEQAIVYDLPTNLVKSSDSNTKAYIEKYGKFGWECDSLRSDVLQKILKDEIHASINLTKFLKMLDQEDLEKQQLSNIINSWKQN